jgi:hypothetical protein
VIVTSMYKYEDVPCPASARPAANPISASSAGHSHLGFFLIFIQAILWISC